MNHAAPDATRTHIKCGKDVVTWAFGHLMEQAPPDVYTPNNVPLGKNGKKKWRLEDLPIIPNKWIMNIIAKSEDQLAQIGRLLETASSVVNAGDPDREGQLLIDEILDHFAWRGNTERVWLAALDDASVDKSITSLRDNAAMQNLRRAAESRSRADWLVGMNLSRAYSIKNNGILSIGRVQTPTMALVVHRDAEIDNFKSRDYYVPRIQLKKGSATLWAAWQPKPDSPGLDEENRLADRDAGNRLAQAVRNATATVTSYDSTQKKQAAPMPFSLSKLQKAASSKFGMSAKQVLDIAQSLYEEHKLTTYPRTDCEYLPASQFDLATDILKKLTGLGGQNGDMAAKADPSIRSAVWNDAMITAHHGIIPTGDISSVNRLSGDEKKLFSLIVQHYLMQFFPPYIYRATKVILSCANESWVATGQSPVSPGWKIVLTGETEEDEDGATKDTGDIPVMARGEALPVVDVELSSKKTTPPARFTDGTLIDAMSNIHKFVTDPVAKATLRETAGIGTEPTRAGILEKLLSPKVGYLERRGKQLISTTKGRQLTAALPLSLTDPVTTAKWEDQLAAIADGTGSQEVFMRSIEGYVREQVTESRGGIVDSDRPRGAEFPTAPCPICGQGVIAKRMESQKKKGFFFWACENKDAHNLMKDEGGKPGAVFSDAPAGGATLQGDPGPRCTPCKVDTVTVKTGSGKPYHRCPKCRNAWWPGDAGKLGKKWG